MGVSRRTSLGLEALFGGARRPSGFAELEQAMNRRGSMDSTTAMLDHALTLLAPGGRLVYCTCSLLPDEGEVQIEDALTRHPELSVVTDTADLPWIAPEWRTSEGGLRLRPDHWSEQGGMDGFYIAVLAKAG